MAATGSASPGAGGSADAFTPSGAAAGGAGALAASAATISAHFGGTSPPGAAGGTSFCAATGGVGLYSSKSSFFIRTNFVNCNRAFLSAKVPLLCIKCFILSG